MHARTLYVGAVDWSADFEVHRRESAGHPPHAARPWARGICPARQQTGIKVLIGLWPWPNSQSSDFLRFAALSDGKTFEQEVRKKGWTVSPLLSPDRSLVGG